jgi:glucose/arabinose dehydrogenase
MLEAFASRADFSGRGVLVSRVATIALSLALFLAAILPPAAAQGIEDPIPRKIRRGNVEIRLQQVASGLTAPVWATTNGVHTGRLFVADQAGTLWAINLATGAKRVFADVGDLLVELGAFGPGTFDERGFLGVAFHPNYARNGLLYTYTSEPPTGDPDFSTMPAGETPDHQNVVREWRVPNPSSRSSVVNPGSSRELLRMDHPAFNHNAGALNFGPDGKLYIAVGDGGTADDQGVGHSPQGNGQDPSNPLGDMLRISPRGSNSANGEYGIPSDNPFVDEEGMLPEIFALGFRNPFRFSFDSKSGRLYAADVGQNHIEEVDIVRSGRNYGWRLKEGTFRFNPNGDEDGFVTENSPGRPRRLTDPIAQYDHDEGVAAVGGFVYRGRSVPELKGHYVFGEFSRTFSNDGRLFHLPKSGRIKEFHLQNRGALGLSLLGFGQDARRELYVLANSTATPFGDTGVVLRIRPGNARLEADLNGFAEVDPETGQFGAGDLNGDGFARIHLRRAARRVCFRLAWSDITRPIAAHIHEGRVGVNGPVVVDLLGNADAVEHQNGRGRAMGCAEGVSRALLMRIAMHPRAFYVNVHTDAFPGGAIRGNLERNELGDL